MGEPEMALAEPDEVEEEDGVEGLYPTTLKQENPRPVTNVVNTVISFIAANGWYIVGFLLLGYVAWMWYKPKIKRWLEKREEEREAAMHHKNPDILLAKHKTMDEVRQRMQEQYNITASIKLAEMETREEMKREDKIKKWEGLGGHSLKSQDKNRASVSTSSSSNSSSAKSKSATKPRLRPEYNPMTGDTGASNSCRWRPSNRGASGGG